MTPPLNDSMIRILDMVATERGRQELLKSQGKFEYTCADKAMSHFEALSVLTEETGEVAHEVNESIGGRPLNRFKLIKELIEVAAVAVAWAEKTLREVEIPSEHNEFGQGANLEDIERRLPIFSERTELYTRTKADAVMAYCPAVKGECTEPCIGSVCNKLAGDLNDDINSTD